MGGIIVKTLLIIIVFIAIVLSCWFVRQTIQTVEELTLCQQTLIEQLEKEGGFYNENK